mmetsp:Transcript_130110/g.324379  ORF Transcript_130110/g.324379 Transcript_130110/m.324379 type:complete len:786 (-) Transcript_130110:56-2413(-)
MPETPKSETPGSGFWDGKIFKLRDFACNPGRGSVKNVDYEQTMGRLTLRYVLKGELADLDAQHLRVELSSWELRVNRCTGGEAGIETTVPITPLSGDLLGDVRRELSWWVLEKEANGDNVFTMELGKREHKVWSTLWKVGLNHHRKTHFGWNNNQKASIKKAEEMLVRVKAGRLSKAETDPFIMSREILCSGLEDGQDDAVATMRIHLDPAATQKACESVCLANLFGLDVTERYLKLFIRGDERSPILMGELGGPCVPDLTRWEIVKAQAPSDDPAGRSASGFSNCLQITIAKAKESRRRWPRILTESEHTLERDAAPESLEDLKVAPRPKSPDRTGWTPADHAKESKAKGDACFKKNDWRDAIVYYTRAIGHTPEDEKLYSNRAACYTKLKKFEKALTDAKKCVALKPNWPKAYFRQGQALRGLERFDEAVVAFKDGRFRDPSNPDWEKEIEKTEDERDKFDAYLREQRRLKREADLTTELNEASVVAEREAMVAVAEQALRAGKSRKEAGELAQKGAELAKQRVHEMGNKKKAMMVEDDYEANEPAPYRIVHEDGTIHPKGFAHTDKGTYHLGMVVMNAERPPTSQPWVEIRHPSRLRWTQGCAQLRLKVTLPESVSSAAEVEVKLTPTSIHIGTAGNSDPVVAGDFERKVDPQGENYSWYLIPDEKPAVLEVTIDKDASEVYQTFSYGTLLWPRLFNDDIQLGEGLFEADLTDLPPHLLEKWRREQDRSSKQSMDDRKRRQRLTEEEIMEETSRNWNDEFARHGMATRFDTNEDRMIENYRQ